MPWVRLDDHFDEHPKLAEVGPLGLALWVSALAYCNRNLTDGLVPYRVAHSLLSFEGIGVLNGMQGEDVSCEMVARMLIDAGLWASEGRDYRIHDYLDYQPSRADVLADRTAKSDAGRKGAHVRWQGHERIAPAIAPAIAEPMAERWQNDAPYPDPVPDPVPDPKPGPIKTAGAHAPGADAPREKSSPPSKKSKLNGRASPVHSEQYQALIDGLGYDIAVVKKSKAMNDCLNAAAKQLDELTLGREDVLFICDDLRHKWKGVDFGPMAVAKWAATYERGP